MNRLARSFALLLTFAGLLLGAADANALACTSAATGNWNAAATWLAPCNVAGGPVAGDTVTIAAAHTVTVTANAAATSITIAAPSVAAHGVNINPGIALNVSGAITLAAPAVNGRTSTLAVGAGTLTAASIAINGGTVTKISQVTVSTGTITVTGNISFAGTAANARFVSTGASMTNVGGNFLPGALTTTATGTINFNGGGAQSMGAFATYNNITVNKAAGTVTMAGNATLAGSLTVTSGTLNKNTRTLAVAGNLAVNGAITGTSGNITLSGAAATIDGIGSITTTTGVLTITNAKTIPATANLTIASPITLSAATTVTNNGIINKTTTTALNGANATTSIWLNAANSTLNYAGTNAPMATGVLNAAAVPNTVNYTGAAQAVKATTYHHLGFGGSLAKTAAAGLTVNGDLTLSGTATFTAGAFTHNFAGNWIVNTTAAAPLSVATTSVINFNTPAIPTPTSMGGTTAATIAFADVNINNTSGVTFNDNASFSTGTTPTLTVAAGATLTPAAAVIISGTGTLTGSGTAQVTRTAAVANFASQYTIATKTLTNLTVDFAGVGTAQTVDVLTYGSATGGGLKVSNANGVSLTANTTVAGTLTLASGAVSTGAFTLITSRACNAPSVVRTGGHVAGFLQKNIPVGAPVNCTFEVGDAATYRPIDTTFVSVSTAGNLVGSVSQAAGEHPQCCGATPFGLDSAKDVNRYWTLTNPGGIVFTTYSATFNFINPTDFDAGADPNNFEVEFWNGAWNTTTFGTRTLTSTQASGIAAFGDFAVGEKKLTLPGSFNAFETSTAAGAINGRIYTKLAGVAFGLDVVAISGGAQMNTFTNTVTVELLGNQTTGVPLDAQNCPTSFTLIQTVTPNPSITGGRSTVNFAAVANAWKDVRVRVRYPVASPTVTSCSTDNFSIRPTGFTVSSTVATNTGTSGAPAIKTGAGFNLTAASVAGYNGTPAIDNTAVTGIPNAGTIGGGFAAAAPATGTAAGNAFFYSEAGNFGLNANAVFDNTFTSVDQPNDCTADFSNALVGGQYGCNFGSGAVPFVAGSSGFGRFIPDNFNVSYNAPAFGTACGTFGYVGQSFSYTIAPVITVTARNGTANGLTNATTANYTGAYMKITSASLTGKAYAAATGALDVTGLPATDPVIADAGDGTVTLTFSSGTGVWFSRAAPAAPFDAEISLAINVLDSDGVAFSGNPASFGAPSAGNGIAFSGGKQMRFGRLKLSNAHGSELLNLPVPVEAQYWNGSAFVRNTADNCTTLAASNVKLTTPPAGVSATVGGAFTSGVGSLTLTKPTAPAKVSVDLCVDLDSSGAGDTTCQGSAPFAVIPHLQTGAAYNKDPAARATFGVYKGGDEFIYLREAY